MHNHSNTASQINFNKKINFLSQYDSYESQSQRNSNKHIKSSRIMKKLKELWNRQKYLTDDEIQSGRDQQASCSPEHAHIPKQLCPNKPTKRQQFNSRCAKQQLESQKRLHVRQVSDEDDNLNLIRKRSHQQVIKSQQATKKDNNDMDQLQQIAAFNSEIENESR